MGSCRVCGRQVEVSDSGQAMPCSCINHPLGRVIWKAIEDCVGPPSLEVPPEGATCATCGANWRLSGPCDECQAAGL